MGERALREGLQISEGQGGHGVRLCVTPRVLSWEGAAVDIRTRSDLAVGHVDKLPSTGPTEKQGPDPCKHRPDITPDMIDKYLKKMYLANPDLVLSVSREFVRNCPVPLLVMPDDTESHCYTVAMEMVHLAPNAQVSLFPWKDTKENVRLAARHARTFLRTNRPRN